MTDQEEADTQLLLHTKCTQNAGYKDVAIHIRDTDVFILMVTFSIQFENFHMETGTEGKTRTIEDFIVALPGHAFTGCDIMSSFTGKGKVKAFKVI